MTQSTTSVPHLNHHTNESASFGEIARRRRLAAHVPLWRVADELGFTPAHIDEFPEDLIALCRECHAKFHDKLP